MGTPKKLQIEPVIEILPKLYLILRLPAKVPTDELPESHKKYIVR